MEDLGPGGKLQKPDPRERDSYVARPVEIEDLQKELDEMDIRAAEQKAKALKEGMIQPGGARVAEPVQAQPVSENMPPDRPMRPSEWDFNVSEDEGPPGQPAVLEDNRATVIERISGQDFDDNDDDVQQRSKPEGEGLPLGGFDLKGYFDGLDPAGVRNLMARIDDFIGDGESSRSSSESSLTNIPGMNFDQPLDDFMYPPENVDAYNEYMQQKFLDEGKDPSEVPSYHNFAKAREEKNYPDLSVTEKTKRVLDDRGNLRADDPGIQAHMGPTTVAGREVYPEFGSADEPLAPFGGNWRDIGTDQVLQRAWRTGNNAEQYGEKYGEYANNALPGEQILDLPAAGWDNLGEEPGLFASKQTKNAYKQRAANAHKIANDAHAKARNGEMPPFIKASAFGRAQWDAAEQARRAKEDALRERIHKGRPRI
jgi:hypothetical protein